MCFVGIESYDLILYLCRTLNALGCSTACIDNSRDKSLAWAVPGGVADGAAASYQNTDFAAGVDATVFVGKSDYVFVYCGFSLNGAMACNAEEVYVVTDYQVHHLEALCALKIQPEAFPFLIVRERVTSKLKPEFVMEYLQDFNFNQDNTFVLEDGLQDLEAKILCQNTDNYTFNKVSQGIRDFVVQALSVDFGTKEITAAFKTASRRV